MMSNLSRLVLIVAVGGLIALGSLGCGGTDDSAAPPTDSTAGTTSAERVIQETPTITSEMPSASGENRLGVGEELKNKIAIPDYYPEDGPVYPGTLPSYVRVMGSKVALAFGLSDSPDKAESIVMADLKGKGWTLTPPMELPTGTVINGTKAGREVTVLISTVPEDSGGETTMMMVSVQR
ncbi:MAG: hypothetical protein CL917_16665 [Deltaproteobacteria bacterium]|nr:hypothetical protein [Deltaproteobacteria bacterium]